MVADARQILAAWQNLYGNSPKLMEANDGVPFAMTWTTDDMSTRKSSILHVSSARKMDITLMNALRMTSQETRTDQVS